MYQKEIESVDFEIVETEIRQRLKSALGQISYYKGMMTEYAVVNT